MEGDGFEDRGLRQEGHKASKRRGAEKGEEVGSPGGWEGGEASADPTGKTRNLKKKLEMELMATMKTAGKMAPDLPTGGLGRARTSSDTGGKHPRSMLRRMLNEDEGRKGKEGKEGREGREGRESRDSREGREREKTSLEERTEGSRPDRSEASETSERSRDDSVGERGSGKRLANKSKSRVFTAPDDMAVISEGAEENSGGSKKREISLGSSTGADAGVGGSASPGIERASEEESSRSLNAPAYHSAPVSPMPSSPTPFSHPPVLETKSGLLFQIQKTGNKKKKEEERWSRSEFSSLAPEDLSPVCTFPLFHLVPSLRHSFPRSLVPPFLRSFVPSSGLSSFRSFVLSLLPFPSRLP
jgi:hypothetical protein